MHDILDKSSLLCTFQPLIETFLFKVIQQEFGSFDAYIWGFTDSETIVEDYHIRTTSPLSDTISKDLKKRGMKFVGSTIIYSYLQAIGVLNAHGEECDLCPDKSEATS